jgi:hypothetical protein
MFQQLPAQSENFLGLDDIAAKALIKGDSKKEFD